MDDFAKYHWEGVATAFVVVLGLLLLARTDRCALMLGALVGIALSSLWTTLSQVRIDIQNVETAHMAVAMGYFWGAVWRGFAAGVIGAAVVKWFLSARRSQQIS